MSAEILAALYERRAFQPQVQFDLLAADHVPFDELTGTSDTEAAVIDALEQEHGCVAVAGPIGAGKSSVIAWVAAGLSEGFACLRVPVIAVGRDDLAEPARFAQHVLREVALEAEELSRRDLEAIKRSAADEHTLVGRQRSTKLSLKIQETGLAHELRSASEQFTTTAAAADARAGLRLLEAIVTTKGMRLVLIIEDTDAWLGRGATAPQPEIAEAFFTRSLDLLIRELAGGVIVAVHDDYIPTPGFQAVQSRLGRVVEIPRFERPVEQLRQILSQRIQRAAVDASVDDVFDAGAIERLEAEFDHADRDLRRVLGVVTLALDQAGPDFPELITQQRVRAAANMRL